jgi:hypothetical protein
MTCQEQAVALCNQLGPMGPLVFTLLGLVLAGFERWNAKRKLDAQKAEAAAAQAALDEKLAKVKAERSLHAARAQELEVKIASIRPPPPDVNAGVES